MIGVSSLAALAISSKVSGAAHRYLGPPHPQVAGLALIEARLQALHDRLPELTGTAHDFAELERILAHASARIEEWTA